MSTPYQDAVALMEEMLEVHQQGARRAGLLGDQELLAHHFDRERRFRNALLVIQGIR